MSKRFRRLSHTIYECKYHLIFCPKYRRRVLKDEIREYTRREIENLLRQKEGIEIIQMRWFNFSREKTLCKMRG